MNPPHMGIAGTNREGMRKYRRFVGNLKWRSSRGGDLGVRNANAAQFLEPWRAASIGHFAPRGFCFENGAVTVLSRNDGAFSLILSERA